MRLKELRKKANLSQAKVAEAVDVEQGAVSKWENGHHYPDLPTCFKLAALFGVPFMSLFEDQSIDSELVELVEFARTHPADMGLILSPYRALKERETLPQQ